MEWPRRLLCCLFLSLSLSAVVQAAATRRHNWEISYQFKHPDCVRKLAVTINGQTPGPTIRATQGDTVVVVVKNSLLTENVAIHWHGIRQHGTPWADGTGGVTQCPILPGDTFTYAFVVDRPGTYMYHGHYGMHRSAGLNGMIVVVAAGKDAEPFKYDGEHDVLLNDSWHKSTYEQATGLASVPIVGVGDPTVAPHQRSREVRQLLGGGDLQRHPPGVRHAGVHRRAGEDLPVPYRQRHLALGSQL